MAEIDVTLTEEEATALLPWPPANQSSAAWNRRADAAERAQGKIRQALADAPDAPAEVEPDQMEIG